MSLNTFYAIPPLAASLGNLFLGGVVLGKRPRGRLNQVWAFLSLCLAVWSFGTFALYLSSDSGTALFWLKLYNFGVVLIPAAFLHFVLALTEDKTRSAGYLLVGAYSVSVLFFGLGFTPLFNAAVRHHPWGYYPVTGPVNPLFDALFAGFLCLSAYKLIAKFRRSGGRRRNQYKYVFVAAIIGFGGGATNFLPLYGATIYPVGHIAIIFTGVIISLAIVKYQLMDINLVIRKSVVYSVLTAAVAASYVGTVFILQTVFQSLTGYRSLLPAIVVALIIALTFEPARRNIQMFVDRIFFKRTYESQQVMRTASETLRSVINPNRISSFLLETVTETLQSQRAWVLLRDNSHYVLAAAKGMPEDTISELRFPSDSGLAEYLVNKKRPVWLDDPEEKVLSRRVDREDRQLIQALGAHMLVPLHGKAELVGMLFMGEKKSGDVYNQDDCELLAALCDQAAISIENSRLYSELQTSYLNTIRSLVAALEAKDEYTRGHSERVARYARDISREMGLSKGESQLLYEVSLLHDVGKIGISEEILNKPTKLSEREFSAVRDHSLTGERILSSIDSLKEGLPTIRHHHERLNGQGYPDGLSDIDIPLPARILAVADAFDAMTTKRPYRPAMSARRAIAELKQSSCHQFDPHVVRAFLAVLARTGQMWGRTAAPANYRQRHSKTVRG